MFTMTDPYPFHWIALSHCPFRKKSGVAIFIRILRAHFTLPAQDFHKIYHKIFTRFTFFVHKIYKIYFYWPLHGSEHTDAH